MPQHGYPRPDPRLDHGPVALNPMTVASVVLIIAAIAVVLVLTYI
jgi:hypothetical protein